MKVLVDWDNLVRADRDRGLVFVAERISETITAAIGSVASLDLRLYGGWYIERSLTHAAQRLTAEALRDFPRTWTRPITVGGGALVIRVELAYSLIIDPARHLWHTYRPRGVTSDIGCRDPLSNGCSAPTACPLEHLSSFIAKERCPETSCPVTRDRLLYRRQQKLVDSMLTVDLLTLGRRRGEQPITIVTSDDDIWPAVRAMLLEGGELVHIHTLSGRTTPHHYAAGSGPHYVQASL